MTCDIRMNLPVTGLLPMAVPVDQTEERIDRSNMIALPGHHRVRCPDGGDGEP